MTNNLKELIEKIEALKIEIDSFRPLSTEMEGRIMQKFRLDWNYHSNHIEGNQLTYGETKTFLLHGITASGKTLKDHLEIKGHNEAILLLEDIVKQERPLTEHFIRKLHKLILHEPYERPAITAEGKPTTKKIEIGKYKSQSNHVKTGTGEMFYFASPEETPAKMNDLMDWLEKASADAEIHSFVIAALFHYKFIRIHPFDDGNGRLARILMNLVLMKVGFPPVVIKTEKKQEYFTALRQADGGDELAFVAYIGEQLLYSLELYLKGAKGESIEEDDDIDKEIKLLKAQLRGEEESERIFMDRKYIHSIYNQQIRPFVDIVCNKLSQFDDFFHVHYININGIAANTNLSLHGSNLTKENLIPELDDFVNKSNLLLDSEYLQSIGVDFHFENFKKGHIPFDYIINCRLDFDKYSFATMDKHSILYHENNEHLFKEIANALAKNALNFIKMKIDNPMS
jgi:Fic family protein